MSVDPETAVYIGYGLIALVGIGLLVYAKLFLIDGSDDRDGKR